MSDSEEVYEVEKILAHRHQGKRLSYKLKWRGYGDEHNTWEDAENVFCEDLILEYWKSRGEDGPPVLDQEEEPISEEKTKKRKDSTASDSQKAKRGKRTTGARRTQPAAEDLEEQGAQSPSAALQDKLNWKNLKHVDTIERKPDGTLAVWVQWKNGTQTAITHQAARKNCPIALIDFYERHLKFHEVTDENDQ